MAGVNGVQAAGQAPPTGPDRPASARRWWRWLLAATVAWAVLLGALTWISVRDDPPTVREQRSLTEAGPVVDRAVGELVAAAGDTAVLTPPVVDRGCRVTPFADGADLSRGVDVFVATGGERTLLEQVADRLPADWRAGVRATSDGPRLRADAGEFVTVSGRVEGDGRVRLTVDTGCRPVGDGYAVPAIGAAGAEADALAEALRTLGGPAGPAPEPVAAPCPGGGTARTVRSAGVPAPASPAAALAPVARVPVLDGPQAYAYRRGPVTVVADLSGDRIVLSATTGCAA
ncbi:hypothetical protein OG777_20235 [Micromonospora peucetia]|uniref:Uncharacterized protein n=1 Tax=Micromonospora peucetia TaxID=47871 RepID=A0A1C6V5U3_9ACTN|nr:hypothetical protein [Micromonospora peucetia]MCX4389240.1 hypothetical protein [Micromonospora peucetia]WSA35687.1 hypothetical protein OIE14_15985 [Micromonospora peucetia]SCL61722.1 hypothetical protein GA0070608_2519 [Micromonospora peucetia]